MLDRRVYVIRERACIRQLDDATVWVLLGALGANGGGGLLFLPYNPPHFPTPVKKPRGRVFLFLIYIYIYVYINIYKPSQRGRPERSSPNRRGVRDPDLAQEEDRDRDGTCVPPAAEEWGMGDQSRPLPFPPPQNQKSVHLPFLSQSPNLVGSSNRPPLLGPPHSTALVPRQPWGSTNISSSLSSSSRRRSGSVDTPCEQVEAASASASSTAGGGTAAPDRLPRPSVLEISTPSQPGEAGDDEKGAARGCGGPQQRRRRRREGRGRRGPPPAAQPGAGVRVLRASRRRAPRAADPRCILFCRRFLGLGRGRKFPQSS